jgi:hypothetical protein
MPAGRPDIACSQPPPAGAQHGRRAGRICCHGFAAAPAFDVSRQLPARTARGLDVSSVGRTDRTGIGSRHWTYDRARQLELVEDFICRRVDAERNTAKSRTCSAVAIYCHCRSCFCCSSCGAGGRLTASVGSVGVRQLAERRNLDGGPIGEETAT